MQGQPADERAAAQLSVRSSPSQTAASPTYSQLHAQAELLAEASAHLAQAMHSSSASTPSLTEELISSAIYELMMKQAGGHLQAADSGMQTVLEDVTFSQEAAAQSEVCLKAP